MSARGRPVVPCLVAGLVLVAALVASCAKDEPNELQPTCPNELPTEGAPCEPGLLCSYADPTGCTAYFVAICGESGTWRFEGECTPDGGPGGGGAATTTTTSSSSTTAGGGAGGQGGSPCTDPLPGPPHVSSALSASYAADTLFGSYRLEFDEAVSNVAAHLSWTGQGQIESVTKSGSAAYVVRFSGLPAGDSAMLTVGAGVPDSCGTELESSVAIAIGLYPHCHLLSEDFAGSFPPTDWAVADAVADGNLWARNDTIGASPGVPNHSNGTGTCASANDDATGTSSDWDTTLTTPAIDLSGASNVVLAFESAFDDRLGAGQAWVEASGDGSSWSTLAQWTDDRGPLRELVELDDYVGGPVYLRWRYSDDAGAGGWWDVDDVCVEHYTKASCSCPAGGHTETKDVLGLTNGNGTRGTAEPTGVVLQQVDDRVSACGRLEVATASGPDWHVFSVNSGMPGGTMGAVLRYCIENSFEPATVELWSQTGGTPVVSVADAHTEGEVDVELVDGETYYLYIAAGSTSYEQARYSLTVQIASAMTALVAEGFESWPLASLTVTDEDGCADWQPAMETVEPPDGALPTQGYYLAYFNSWECPEGIESLETDVLNLASYDVVVLTFDMYHDTGYASSIDTIQVQVDVGNGWVDYGLPFERPASVAGWTTETLDLSTFAGDPSVQFRLRATSAYGNDIHIDNVLLMAS